MEPIIELAKIRKVYPSGAGEAVALDSVDLVVERGEFMALAGPSGSGKTSLLDIAGALDEPSSGRVRVAGRDLAGLRDRELARMRNECIGFVFQSFNLVPSLTVAENVELPLRLSGKWRGRRLEARSTGELLEAVGLAELASRLPGQLSGGQRQRVAVARALAARPELVLADEPTANLDSKTGKAVVELMKSLNARYGTTFLFSTHDPAVMAEAARLVRLSDGKIVSDSGEEP
jgi:putative ABC transport system ATP-binding protein